MFSAVSLIYNMMATEIFSIRGRVKVPDMIWRGTEAE
jgi:hypothetical protein